MEIKKIIFSLWLVMSVVSVTAAANISCGTHADCPSCYTCNYDTKSCVRDEFCVAEPPAVVDSRNVEVSSVTERVANFLTYFIGGIAGIAVIWGGIVYATALGDEQKIQRAKSIIKWAVVAVVVVLGARLLVGLVYTVLT